MIDNKTDEFNEYIVLTRRCFEELKETIIIINYNYNELQDNYNELQDKYNELQNSFEESQDDLASTQDDLASTQDDLAVAGAVIKDRCKIIKVLREELHQMKIKLDEVEEARDNWKTEAIRRQNELNDIEMRNLMREKPAQECCYHCDKTDCSDCPICPF